MQRKVITTGERFTDIDALACVIAYSELLEKQGGNTLVYLPGKLNHSVTDTVKSWDYSFTDSLPKRSDRYFYHYGRIRTKSYCQCGIYG